LYPLRRIGAKGEGKFERITWDAALDEIATRLNNVVREHGSEAVLPYSYAGTMGILNGSGMDRRFFHRLGASRLDRTICSSAGGEALMLSQGARLGIEPEQFAEAKLIIAWGANVLGTNVHLWPWIVEARRKGAKFYTIDPVKNRTGRAADKHFAIHPGSDLALALGLIHVILRDGLEDRRYVAEHTNGFSDLERLAVQYTPGRVAHWTGIPAEEIESLAREYATANPAAIRVNYGVQRSDRGGSAVRAIAALPVVTGAWRKPGGGLQLTTSGAFQFNRAALELPELQKLSPLRRAARVVNMAQLGSALVDFGQCQTGGHADEAPQVPIHALVVYNSNPAAIAPNQSKVVKGLKREDLFTVSIEQFLTDTTDYADIVLPTTTFLEHTDIYLAYGHYHLQLARAALPAPGETKSNVEIFRLLAKRLGFLDACFDDSEDRMVEALLGADSPFFTGITLERLEREHSIRLNISPAGEPFLPFAAGKFQTPSGKFEFGADALDYTPPAESRFGDAELTRQYPFELITGKNDDSMNSTFGNREDVDRQTAVLSLHPLDAAQRGITHGMEIEAMNGRGSCFFQADLDSDVPRGVARARSMRWSKGSRGRWGVNHLTSERLTDIGGGPTFYSCLVDLRPALCSK
jgi:anaerobic selenocysteine-containing dehydrogenase